MKNLRALFVQDHREDLFQRVTSVDRIATLLKDQNIIDQDMYAQIVHKSTDVDKMTTLLDALKNDSVKCSFYDALTSENKSLIEELQEQDAEFVNQHSAKLIRDVTNVLPIADVLFSSEFIHRETYTQININSTTSMDKMRILLDALNSNVAKSALYSLLKDMEHLLIEQLKRQGSEEEQDNHVTASQAECGIVWNSSSIVHRRIIEDLQKDPSTKKVGSIYFCKSDKYIIGSGGSCTVYVGLKEDGTEVALKRMLKDSLRIRDFENELKHLRALDHESKNIVRYVDLAQDEDFYYLALQLCEYDMEHYVKNLEQKNKDVALKKIVQEILFGLQVLHKAEVIHRDIKPGNVLMDSGGNARLADFGLSRRLEEGRSIVHTHRAGARGWEASESLNQTEQIGYKKSSDIQVAGMLVYYIFSGGEHPFGDVNDRESNIKNGKYSLDHVKDSQEVKDLIEWMINKDPVNRPNINQVLNHPLFWDDRRVRDVLRNLGDKQDVQEYESYEEKEKLFKTVWKYTDGKTIENWKSKVPNDWGKFAKNLPDNLLGLLRYLRNQLVHNEAQFYKKKMVDKFPDFLISLYRFAVDMEWEPEQGTKTEK